MIIAWDKIYAACIENVAAPYTAILPRLAESLGLSEPTLIKLGIGFAPAVEFSKRTTGPWWVIPERNAEGKIMGLSIRSDSGAKVMYPGSKHGLIYSIRPGYQVGSKGYTPGRHNWVRTMDAGKPCPVCGRPDGCLLSAENPDDPRAVLCIRKREGATRPGNMDTGGWLHIRKPEGNVTGGAGPLEESKLPVIVVEGMTDAATAMDIGFVSVGRPSNLAGLGYLREVVRGRKVLIIGENDKKSDGRWPGRDGMEAAFETVKNVCEARKLLPPESFKDLRDWVRAAGLDSRSLLSYADENATNTTDSRNLDTDEPVKITSRWLKEEHMLEGIPILRKYAGDWYRFNGRAYGQLEEEAFIRGGMYRWLDGRMVATAKDDGEVKMESYNADKHKINNLIDALAMDCPLLAEPPCWLDARTEPNPKHLITFPNGVLDVYAHIAGNSSELLPLSPMFFTFGALPYDFDPTAECPMWRKFLREIFPDDPKKIMLLQEWFGYNLIPDTSEQKLMVFNGPSGSGKSTVLYVKEAMLGAAQVCHPSLSGLGQEFGLTQFIGKLAAHIGDGELDPSAKKRIIMERIKELTGSPHPVLMVRRMHVAEEAVHLFARITLACNDLPDLPDSGGALPRRTLALAFTEKFDTATRTPDRNLGDTLVREVPGVFNWALEGLERLKRIGAFTIPASSEQLARKFAANASPISQFVDNCTEVGGQIREDEMTLFDAWRNYAREHAVAAGMRLKFFHNLTMNISSLRLGGDTKNGKYVPIVYGIKLTKEARERYLAK